MIEAIRERVATQMRELVRSERGIALPMALMITVIAMGFAAVPIVASVSSQSGDSRNQGGNEALAAAEAGAELAVLRQSKALTENTTTTTPSCASGSTLAKVSTSYWCSKYPATPEAIGNAKFQYRVRPCYYSGNSSLCGSVQSSEPCTIAEKKDLVQVVSVGYAIVGGKEVTRRVQLAACAKAMSPEQLKAEEELIKETNEKTTHSTELQEDEKRLGEKIKEIERVKTEPAGSEQLPGETETYTETTKSPPPDVWAGGQIVGVEWLNMNNNAQVYNGGAGSNGYVTLSGSANVCGAIHYGTTFTTDNSSSNTKPASCAAGRTATQGTATYPPVTLPSDIATNNSDGRICTEAACHAGADPVPGSVWQRENVAWSASNKQLTLKYSSLTLEGTAPYYLCQLVLAGGSSLYSGSGKAIKIYFAPPSACPGLNGAPQLQIANGTYVYGDSASGPLFLFVGSNPASNSKIEFAGGAKSEQFVVYAPYSQVIANNGIEMTGSIIGNTIELAGGASINRNGTFTPPPAESFLPTQETTVTKTREGPKKSTPSKYLKELESQRTVIEEEIAGDKKKIGEDEKHIKETEEKIAKLKSEGGAAAQPLSRKSFVECSAEPPKSTESPDKGC